MGGLIPFGPGPLYEATEVAQLPLIRNKQIEAVKQYASVLFPAPKLIGLLMDLNVPKGGFRHVSEFMTRRGAAYTAATGLPFPRPIPSRDRFIVGPLHPIASTPCSHHPLEAAPHFPPPWGCLPVRRWKLDKTFHWAPPRGRAGLTTRLPMGDWQCRRRGQGHGPASDNVVPKLPGIRPFFFCLEFCVSFPRLIFKIWQILIRT